MEIVSGQATADGAHRAIAIGGEWGVTIFHLRSLTNIAKLKRVACEVGVLGRQTGVWSFACGARRARLDWYGSN